jgi:glycosyltransferase involved in cell wall biosynthesis
MNVHVYTQVWNEAVLMPYFLRHYSTFCDKIVVYDDDSTDGTRDIVNTCPIAEVRQSLSRGVDDAAWIDFWSSVYKESRGIADWVILVDGDEFIYHPDIIGKLEQYRVRRMNMPFVQGYNMVSEAPPTTDGQIYEELFSGYAYAPETKRAVIDPMLDVCYEVGRHSVHVAGAHISDNPDLALLHYNQLGIDYIYARRSSYAPRMSAVNVHNKWGVDYVFSSKEAMQGEYEAGASLAKPLVGIIAGAREC